VPALRACQKIITWSHAPDLTVGATSCRPSWPKNSPSESRIVNWNIGGVSLQKASLVNAETTIAPISMQ